MAKVTGKWIEQDSTHRFVSDTQILSWDGKLDKTGGTMTGLLTLDNLGMVYDVVDTPPTVPTTGQTWWDINLGSPVVYLENSSVISLTEDRITRVRNDGTAVGYAALVYASDVSGHKIIIKPAIATSKSQVAGLQGWTTSSLGTNVDGYAKMEGILNNLNTTTDSDGNALAVGDLLYLSASVAGGYTKVPPTNKRLVGVVMEVHGSQGKIMAMVNPPLSMPELIDTSISSLATNQYLKWNGTNWVNSQVDHTTLSNIGTNSHSAIDTHISNVTTAKTDTAEETGFVDPENISVSYNSTTRKVTLTHASNLYYYYRGIRADLGTSWESTAHDDVTANYWLYLNNLGAAQWSTTFPGFENILVAYIVYGASDKFVVKETHGLMPWLSHRADHYAIGTYIHPNFRPTISSLAAGSTQADLQPLVTSCKLMDEDLPVLVNEIASEGNYTRLHFTSNGATAVFTPASADILPFSGGNPQYNLAGNSLATITSGSQYFNVYLIATTVGADATSQQYRYLFMLGQGLHTSQAAAEAEDPRNFASSALSALLAEFNICARITLLRTTAAPNYNNTRWISTTYIVGTRQSPVSVSGLSPTSHTSLLDRSEPDQHPASAITNTPSGIVTATNVQAAIDFLGSRYVASLSWSGTGPYTMTITGATHLRGVDPLVVVRQTSGGVSTDVLLDSIAVNDSTGDVTLTSSESITGKVIIM